MTIKQISIQLENVPGSLARLVDILEKEDISTKAISAASTAESSTVRLVVNDPDRAEKVLGSPREESRGAWSPDGRWVYLSVLVEGRSHIWRQQFPDGTPEQVTSGPTEEAGIAMAPEHGSDPELLLAVADAAGVVVPHGHHRVPPLDLVAPA